MRDLEVTLTVRNNQLKERRLGRGLSQDALAVASGVRKATILGLECLRVSSRDRWGRWTRAAEALSDFFDVDPGDLFPAALDAVRQPKAVRRLDVAEAMLLLPSPPDVEQCPQRLLERSREADAVLAAIEHLTPRHKFVLERRRGLNGKNEMTLEEICVEMGSTRERVREIEAQALARLRHPSISKTLKGFIE